MMKVMEHVGKSIDEHATRSSQVTGDPALLRGIGNGMTIASLPQSELSEEAIALLACGNGGDEEKAFAQLTSRGSFWLCAAPHQALALNVNEASLDHDVWPKDFEHANDLWIAINGKALRVEAVRLQRAEEGTKLRFRVFSNVILTGNDGVVASIHKADDADALKEERAVKDKMLMMIV